MANKTRIQIILEAIDRATGPINERLKATETRMAQFRQKTDRITSAMNGFGLAATAAGAAALSAFGVAVKQSAKYEQMAVAMRTLYKGNAEAAKAAMDQIELFAEKTPYNVDQVMDAFIKLKARGMDSSQAVLTAYGDMASALNKPLDQVVEMVADAATFQFERMRELGFTFQTQGDQVTFTFNGVTKTVQKNSEQIVKYLQWVAQQNFAGGMEAQSQTLNGQLSTLQDRLSKTSQIIGDQLVPAVKSFIEFLEPVLRKIQDFAKANPQLVKLAAGIALVTTGLGALALAAGAAFVAFTVISGPVAAVTAAVLGLAYAATAIYVYWEPIAGFFSNLWDSVTAKFNEFVAYVQSIPEKMYEAGANIVNSLKEGIEKQFHGLITMWHEKMAKLRDYLPFSPAKVGPLRDIHKVKLIETIAETITPKPIQQAMTNALAPVAGGSAVPAPMLGGGGGMSLNYAPQITINGAGPGAEANFAAMLQQHKQELFRILSEQTAYKNRVAYG